MSKELIEHLSQFVSESRKQKFEEVLKFRTRHITVVLEDIYQAHNASAVLRSCDCFGIQDVHIIENRNRYTINPDVALGSTKWLNLIKYNKQERNTIEALKGLKQKGYRIVSSTPHTNDVTIQELDISKPLALVFGTEQDGISDEVRELTDEYVKIPMFGFTESFNISVSAAICLSHLVSRLHASPVHWQLPEEEQVEVVLEWYRSSINKVEMIEREFENKSGT